MSNVSRNLCEKQYYQNHYRNYYQNKYFQNLLYLSNSNLPNPQNPRNLKVPLQTFKLARNEQIYITRQLLQICEDFKVPLKYLCKISLQTPQLKVKYL